MADYNNTEQIMNNGHSKKQGVEAETDITLQ